MDEQFIKQPNELKTLNERLKEDEPYTFMFMKQVPMQTARDFVNYADSEFSGHFGFALKSLIDGAIIFKNELDASKLVELNERILQLEKAVVLLKEDKKDVKENVRKRLNGDVIENG